MRAGLGTVQFGADYGVSNARGRVPPDEVAEILALAAQSGWTILDTAAGYGDSESVLGRALWPGHGFQIVTKIPALRSDSIDRRLAGRARDAFLRSLERLRQPAVYGLLVHHAPDLCCPGAEYLMEVLLELKQQGLAGKVGASFYSASDIRDVRRLMPIELAQVPVSLVDQRLVVDGMLSELRQAGTEVHARSVFLQGLLLMEPSALPGHLRQFRGHLQRVDRLARAAGVTRMALAIGFVRSLHDVDAVLVGVTSVQELREVISALRLPVPAVDWSEVACDDEAFLNPSRWPAPASPANA